MKNQEVEVTEEGHVGGGELGAAPHGRELARAELIRAKREES